MQVVIEQVVSRIRAVDGKSALGPETMRAIVQAVLAAVRDATAHDERVRGERSTRNGYLDQDAPGGGE